MYRFVLLLVDENTTVEKILQVKEKFLFGPDTPSLPDTLFGIVAPNDTLTEKRVPTSLGNRDCYGSADETVCVVIERAHCVISGINFYRTVVSWRIRLQNQPWPVSPHFLFGTRTCGHFTKRRSGRSGRSKRLTWRPTSRIGTNSQMTNVTL